MNGVSGWRAAYEASAATFAQPATSSMMGRAVSDMLLFARDSGRSGQFEPVSRRAYELLAGENGHRAAGVLDGIASYADSRPFSQLEVIGGAPGCDGPYALGGLLELVTTTSAGTTIDSDMVRSAFRSDLAHQIGRPLQRAEMLTIREPRAAVFAGKASGDLGELLSGDFAAVPERVRSYSRTRGMNGVTEEIAREIQSVTARGAQIVADPAGQLARERRWGQAHVLLHELEHSNGSVTPDTMRLLGIEEGTAHLHAHWPGAVEDFAAGLGIADEVQRPATHHLGLSGLLPDELGQVHAYQGWSDGLQGYLELAGITPTRAGSLERSRELTRGVPLEQVPSRLAHEIAAHQGADPPTTNAIARIIDENEPGPDAVAAVRSALTGTA